MRSVICGTGLDATKGLSGRMGSKGSLDNSLRSEKRQFESPRAVCYPERGPSTQEILPEHCLSLEWK